MLIASCGVSLSASKMEVSLDPNSSWRASVFPMDKDPSAKIAQIELQSQNRETELKSWPFSSSAASFQPNAPNRCLIVASVDLASWDLHTQIKSSKKLVQTRSAATVPSILIECATLRNAATEAAAPKGSDSIRRNEVRGQLATRR